MYPIEAQSLTLEYDRNVVIDDVDITICEAKVTVLVGSNGSGKSSLLKAFSRLLKPAGGAIILNGADIHGKPTAQVAKELSILPQNPTVPEGLSVYQLVRMGRYPHQTWLQQWSSNDQENVERILRDTELFALKDRPVDSLSGGQRQRVWIAMTLAQETDIILLDEPTTYLDLAHQIDVLDLLDVLNVEQNKTIIMVLHDLNLACRYAHHIVALHDKKIYAQGAPGEILNEATVKAVFNLDSHIIIDPISGTPLCIPMGRKAVNPGRAR